MPCAMFCSIIVLPVRGGATMRPRVPLADRREQIDQTRVVYSSGIVLETQLLVRIERRQVVEEDLVACFLGLFVVDRLDLEQREVAFALLRRADLAGDDVAGAQVEARGSGSARRRCRPDRAGSCSRGAQKAEAVGQNLEHALAVDQDRSARSARPGWRRSAPACACSKRPRC